MMIIIKLVFALVVTLAFIIMAFALEEDHWPWQRANWSRDLRRRWRIIMGRCVGCGHKLRAEVFHRRRERCFHCACSRYHEWHLCHSCAKSFNLAKTYGASEEKAYSMIKE